MDPTIFTCIENIRSFINNTLLVACSGLATCIIKGERAVKRAGRGAGAFDIPNSCCLSLDSDIDHGPKVDSHMLEHNPVLFGTTDSRALRKHKWEMKIITYELSVRVYAWKESWTAYLVLEYLAHFRSVAVATPYSF